MLSNNSSKNIIIVELNSLFSCVSSLSFLYKLSNNSFDSSNEKIYLKLLSID